MDPALPFRSIALAAVAYAVLCLPGGSSAWATNSMLECKLEFVELRNATAVSPDGEVVIGRISSGQGAYWRRDASFARTLLPLGFFPRAVSNNGDVIAGSVGSHAAMWTAADGVVEIHDGSWQSSVALDVSSDGNVIVGTAAVPEFDPICIGDHFHERAIKWIGGGPQVLPDPNMSDRPFELRGVIRSADPESTLFTTFNTGAVAVSGAGETVVGTFKEFRKYRSDLTDEMAPLGSPGRCGTTQLFLGGFINGARVGALPFNTQCNSSTTVLDSEFALVNDVSEDGGVVVGRSDNRGVPPDCDAMVFAGEFSAGGLKILSPIPGYLQSSAQLVSLDGGAIVGSSNVALVGGLPSNGTVWRGDGPEHLDTMLKVEFGLELDFPIGIGSMTNFEGCGTLVLSSSAGNPNIVTLPCRDRDADGLCDRWEEDGGIDLDDDDVIDPANDLVLAGANPDHKDVYVEVDLLSDADLQPGVLTAIERAFAAVPNSLIGNPDGAPGIKLHLELNEQGFPFIPGGSWTPQQTCGQMPVEYDAFRASWFGTSAQRSNPDIIDAKRQTYRYLVIGSAPGTSGKAEWSGNDVLVAGGSFFGEPPDILALAQQGTIMHELGHTFLLLHGGPTESINYKPNYHSVMNYLWQYPYARGNLGLGSIAYATSWILDYARAPFNTLVESSLDEKKGIGGHPRHAVLIGPFANSTVVREAGSVDFDQDGIPLEDAPGDSQADLNDLFNDFPPVAGQTLESFGDWAVVAANLRKTMQHVNWQDGVHNCNGIPVAGVPAAGAQLVEVDQAVIANFATSHSIDCNDNGVDDDIDLSGGLDTDTNANGLLDGCEPTAGDFDDDGDIDLSDRDGFVLSFGLADGETGFDVRADLDGDRLISLVDYMLWVEALDAASAPATPLAPTAGVQIRVLPQSNSVVLDDVFEVQIVADLSSLVLGFGIDVSYDRSILRWHDDPQIGPQWTPVLAPDRDGLSGLAPVAGLVGSNILLATLTFEAIALGDASIDVGVTLDDLNEGFVLRSGGFDGISVVGDQVSVPEPAAWLMQAFAVWIIGSFRRCHSARARRSMNRTR